VGASTSYGCMHARISKHDEPRGLRLHVPWEWGFHPGAASESSNRCCRLPSTGSWEAPWRQVPRREAAPCGFGSSGEEEWLGLSIREGLAAVN
jgi:hypothetical protein